MSDSVQPQRQQPTRLPRPWDSPGKNTGVGCHFLLQCMKVKSKSEVAQWCPTLRDPMDCSLPGSSIHGIFQARVLEWGAFAFSDLSVRNPFYQMPNMCLGFPGGASGKEPTCSIPGSGRSPGKRKWQSTLVFLPGEFHRQRSLVDYHPWGYKGSDTTEAT